MTTEEESATTKSATSIGETLSASGENWEIWNDALLNFLAYKKLATIDVEDSVMNVTIKDEYGTKFVITSNLTTTLKNRVLSKGNATAIYAFLKKEYGGVNKFRQKASVKNIATFEFEGTDMAENITRIEKYMRQFIAANGGSTIKIEDLTLWMLVFALPEAYATIRTILQSDDTLDLESVKTRILEEEQSINSRENTGLAGSLANTESKCSHGRTNTATRPCWHCQPEKNPFNATCSDCHKKGHRSRESKRCKLNSVPRETPTPDPARAGLAGALYADLKPALKETAIWDSKMGYGFSLSGKKRKVSSAVAISPKLATNDLRHELIIDSGCSNTSVFNKEHLLNYYHSPYDMRVANGEVMTAPGRGTLPLVKLTLTGVLWCPDICVNLLSVAQLCDIGLIVTFDSAKCVVTHKHSKEVVLRGVRKGNLYTYTKTPQGHALSMSHRPKSTHLSIMAHRLTGHLYQRALPLLSKISTGLALDSIPEEPCTACIHAKSHRKSFQRSYHHASRQGELVHSDTCEIGIPTIMGGYTHFVTFIDDYSRYIVIYLLRRKGDAFTAFKEYAERVHNITNRHITTIRSDGGGEFFSADMKLFCRERGIFQEKSTRDTPQHNGRAERPNRTIVEGASAMLFDSQLPLQFWGYAVVMKVWLLNRSPHSRLYKSTPFEKWTNSIPDLSSLKLFGQKGYLNITKKHRDNKFSDRGKPLIFVGYSEESKAYIMLDVEKRKEMLSCDVIWGQEWSIGDEANPSVTLLQKVKESNPQFINTDTFQDEVPDQLDLAIDDASNTQVASPEDLSDEYTPSSSEDEDSSEYESDYSNALFSLTKAIDDDSIHFPGFDAWSNALLLLASHGDSPTYDEAMAGPYKKQYQTAIAEEYESIMKNEVFSKPCPLPKGFKALDLKMVLKQKESADPTSLGRFKARLCGKGFKQIFQVDYFDVFAPVAAYNTLRLFVSIMATLDYELDSADVITAFLLSKIQEEIYVNIPDGYPNQPTDSTLVLKLLRCLYGLKQAPFEWNRTLDTHLKSLGFRQCQNDRCIYVGTFDNKVCYLLVYVDDFLIATPDRVLMAKLKALINSRFPIKDNGPIQFYLNMFFIRDRKARTIKIHQQSKIQKLLQDTGADNAPPSKIPADPNIVLSKLQCPKDAVTIEKMSKLPYKSVTGRLLYLSLTARPDIAPAVSQIGRFAQNPGPEHWEAVLKILAYLKGTQGTALCLGGWSQNISISAYSDADWAGDIDQRRSRTGYIVFMNQSPIMWCSKLQSTVALSSMNSEYIALSSTSQEVIWSRSMLEELGFNQSDPSIIWEDNKSCIDIASSYRLHPGSKHIDIRHHFIRDRVINIKDLVIRRKASGDMTADFFTKNLPYPAFSRHRKSIGIVHI